jgi:hypothetical protein
MHNAIMWGVGDWGRTFLHSQESGNEKRGGGG